MNGLGIALATAALQVTLAAVPAAVLVAVVGRRSSRTAAALAALALVLCGLLTAATITPSPQWWSWGEIIRESSASQFDPSPAETPTADSPPGDGWRLPIRRLIDLLPAVELQNVPSRPAWTGWSLLAALFLAGLTVEVLRLLAGLRAVAACRGRSLSILDADLLRVVDELRAALDCRGPVELRSSAEIGTAATVGWRRPAILLADDWLAWSADEQRAVLAHELTHVRRRDYLTGMFAAACRAAHFYHPLVCWLAGRLRLHQELTADALAAGAAGGRTLYLRALARMALRQDERFVAGTARPFLTERGTLLRRVAMLRVTDDDRPLGRAVRWGMAGLLVVAALGASAMRGPAQAPAVDPKPTATTELPPFDLSALPPSAKGFVAIRPAALAAVPGMKPVVESLNRVLKMQFQDLGCAPEFEVPLEAIEQIVLSADLSRISDEDRKRNGNDARHAVLFGLYLIRMRHDFDWPARLRQMSSILKWEEVSPGRFRCQSPLLGPSPISVRVRDARTLVMESDGGQRQADAIHWGNAWQQAERAGIAIALDNRDGHWAKLVGDRLGEEVTPAAKELLERTTHLVLGVNADEHASGVFVTDSADEAAARATVTTIDAIGTFARAATTQALKVSTAEQQRVWLRLAAELFERRPVRRDGTQVRAEGRSTVKIAQLTAQFFEEPMADDKKK